MVGQQPAGVKAIRNLNHLIEVDLDAALAYEAAIARLSDGEDKDRLQHHLEDHRRRVAELTLIVTQLGGTAATQADFRSVLAKGKVLVGAVSGDRGVIEAMKRNEEATTQAYEKALQSDEWPMQARIVIERNFADEERHLDWFEQRVARMRRDKEAEKA
jgi:uncharacterized protein (TIGR02284 family)